MFGREEAMLYASAIVLHHCSTVFNNVVVQNEGLVHGGVRLPGVTINLTLSHHNQAMESCTIHMVAQAILHVAGLLAGVCFVVSGELARAGINYRPLSGKVSAVTL